MASGFGSGFALGKVTQLDFAKYTGPPNYYIVVFDTRYMVIGSYYPDSKVATGVEPGAAFLIDGATEGGTLMIGAWVATFEKQFLYWKQKSP